MRKLTFAFIVSALVAVPGYAHHSFAMYDQTKTLVMTGVAYQFVAQANHAELHFYLIGPDGNVARRWDKVSVDGHAEEVLKAVTEL